MVLTWDIEALRQADPATLRESAEVRGKLLKSMEQYKRQLYSEDLPRRMYD